MMMMGEPSDYATNHGALFHLPLSKGSPNPMKWDLMLFPHGRILDCGCLKDAGIKWAFLRIHSFIAGCGVVRLRGLWSERCRRSGNVYSSPEPLESWVLVSSRLESGVFPLQCLNSRHWPTLPSLITACLWCMSTIVIYSTVLYCWLHRGHVNLLLSSCSYTTRSASFTYHGGTSPDESTQVSTEPAVEVVYLSLFSSHSSHKLFACCPLRALGLWCSTV